MRRHETIDLFAGPGGWDIAAAVLGFEPLGIEWDDAACGTRAAAGLRTLQADVGALDPADFAPCAGLIGSPPCQAFSLAGKGAGRAAMHVFSEAIGLMAQGKPVDRAALDAACGDERAHLVLEPLRWALALRPDWIALEQVEPVLPLWEATADVLATRGYSTWVGTVSAEQYGVPQTRKRALMLAALDRRVACPPPSHQRYIPPRRSAEDTLELFEAPEPERIVHASDEHLEPWVSMAEALGWPAGLPLDHHRGAGLVERHGERADRTTSQPAPTVTAGGKRWGGGPRWTLRANARSNAAVRDMDEPAPTITAGHDHNERRWSYDSRGQRDMRSGEPKFARRRSTDEPAPTIAGQSRNDSWVHDRPATTVCGRPDVFPPGHKINADDIAAGRGGQQRSGAGHTDGSTDATSVRVTLEDALVLQSFPADYPVQGTKSKQFEQVGNAVPPLLAGAILSVLVER